MMPPFVVFPTNRIAHFVEVSLYLFYLAQQVKLATTSSTGGLSLALQRPLLLLAPKGGIASTFTGPL